MTIGPAPITQMDARSGRRGIAELLDPGLDLRPRVVRARARLGVELERARPLAREGKPLDGAVVEGDVRDRRAVAAHSEAVVLARDEDAARRELEHRVVRATVAERELERLEAGRLREELVAEADAEDRHTAEQLPHDRRLARQRRGVSGAVGEQDARRMLREDRRG